ncbi:ABC transporter permease [Denitrobaculum tricleocarpae]|uniref:ABC transporter permease n=1 Tax=Denitrobaculum tricleocarpae TaxID=2591009 RepID=A0A545TKQ3_9PROT|nr:ABC transporter permease [Denitrobaculum tricleocarpae]TQV77787.1 ABC transporter permease [Denitrobaculum tricleocarpae]
MTLRINSLAVFLLLAALSVVIDSQLGGFTWFSGVSATVALSIASLCALWCLWNGRGGAQAAGVAVAGLLAGAFVPLAAIAAAAEGQTGFELGVGLWLYLFALAFVAWRAMALLSDLRGASPQASTVFALLVPALFGFWLLYLWQVLVEGFGVPRVLLPSPSAIGEVMGGSTGTMWADFYQTFIKSVIPGYLMGCGAGLLVAVLVDRVPFLQRGLLPLGNFVSAIPIVGIAPVMVMWFGFDWQSKAAVVVIMTFFPMLVNTIAGLAASGRMERDLMRSYAASYFETLLLLRLPSALPFIFNALKINSTLALIGAIVAEFFGTPIVGMGFRISTEVGRMNVDLVWATIAIAALSGSLFYGGLAMLERSLTFWHPSYRRRGG